MNFCLLKPTTIKYCFTPELLNINLINIQYGKRRTVSIDRDLVWNSLTLIPSLCQVWSELVLWSQWVTAEAVLSDSGPHRVWNGWVENRVKGCVFLPRTKAICTLRNQGSLCFPCFSDQYKTQPASVKVSVLHQISSWYEYVLITFTPLHLYECKGIDFVVSREVPFLRLSSFCHMVILFFTPSLFNNFSL